MSTAHNGDVELYYEVHGSGEPLLLIMGLGYALWGWHAQIPDLARDRQVIAMENRGVGRSTPVTELYTVHDMADDAVAVLDAAGAASAHVVGVSLGGFVTQSLAARYPQRVRSIVLGCTTHGGPDAIPIPPETAAAMLDPGKGLTTEERIRRVMPLSLREGWTQEHPDEFERILAMRLEWVPQWDAFVAQATAGGTADTTELAPTITAPTLIVHGTGDRVVPVGNAELLRSKVPGAKVELLSGAGHLLMMEEPDRFNELVREHTA